MPHVSDHLDAAANALASHNHAAALAALLDAWRAARAPALADAIDTLGERIDLPLLPDQPARELREAWLDIATRGRDADVPRLLEALPRRPFKDVHERIERLVPRGADPRIGLSICRLLTARAMNSTIGTTAWNRLFGLMEQSADVRMRPLLEASLAAPLPGDFGRQLQRGAERVLSSLPHPAPTLEAPLSDKLAAILESIRTLPRVTTLDDRPRRSAQAAVDDEAALLSAIYERPDEDGPRLVYADWLAERGGARGELIQLQFKQRDGKASVKEQKRIAALLRQHVGSWLGPIEPAIPRRNFSFDRGFLSQCMVAFPTPELEATLADHPAWSTVSWLWNDDSDGPFLLRCELRGLRTLARAIPMRLFGEMAVRDRPYGIEDLCLTLADPVDGSLLEALTTLPAFPRLSRLRLEHDAARGPLTPAQLVWLFDGALCTRLQSIQTPYDADPCLWLPKLETLPQLRRLAFGLGYWAELVRDAGAERWTIELGWSNQAQFRDEVLHALDRWLVPMRHRFAGLRLKRAEGWSGGDDLHAIARELRKRIERVELAAD